VEQVLVKNIQESVTSHSGSGSGLNKRMLTSRFVNYEFDEVLQRFVRIPTIDVGSSMQDLHDLGTLPSKTGVHRSMQVTKYGLNVIDIPIKPYTTLFFEEILDPFYIFQLFAVILWCFEAYFIYAGCVAFITALSVVINLRETRRNLQALHDMVKFSGTVRRCNDGMSSSSARVEVVDSAQLLPGDVFELTSEGGMLSCDAVLLEGGVVVNESMLTGESIPVTKVPLPAAHDAGEHSQFNTEQHKSHMLFCGTHVVQTRSEKVRALVIRTGFDTAKGELVRSIMFPKPAKYDIKPRALLFPHYHVPMNECCTISVAWERCCLLNQRSLGTVSFGLFSLSSFA
jgi:cation-transporting P-type ATPase 13A2